MRYVFYFTTTANARGVFFFLNFMKSEGTCTGILLFLATLFLLALSYRFIPLFIWLYILCKSV